MVLPSDASPPAVFLSLVARQLQLDPAIWQQYAQGAETRRQHQLELQAWLGLNPFGIRHYPHFVHHLSDLAQQTDRGIVLAFALVDAVRQQRVIVPTIEVIERLCGEALTRGSRRLYHALTSPLWSCHRQALDRLLAMQAGTRASGLTWLRQPPGWLAYSPAPRLNSALNFLRFDMNTPQGCNDPVISCSGVTFSRRHK